MAKFDEYIYEYLTQNKELSLENIGRLFTGSLPEGVEGTVTAVPAGFSFIYDKKAAPDYAFIDFLAAKTGKPRSLVQSDFSSYLEQMRSFINIGKAYELPGIGVLKSVSGGLYELSATEKKPEFPRSPKSNANQERKNRSNTGGRSALKIFTGIIVIAVLAGLGWGAWSMFIKNRDWALNTPDTETKPKTDTAADNTAAPVVQNASSSNAQQAVPVSATDTVKCRYVQEITPSLLRATTRTAKLNDFGYNAGFDSTGGNGYRIFTIHPSLIKDTAYMRDSLQKNFQKKIFVELINN